MRKGSHCSEENKQKIREALLGKHHSLETRKKMSENHAYNSGEKNPMWGRFGEKHPIWGRRHSEESRKRMSEIRLGKKLSEETCRRMSESHVAKYGKENPCWKGEHVGYSGLHGWVRKYKHKPELCAMCGRKPPYDVANISGLYKRDLDDFKWICRGCHAKSDCRIKNFKDKRKGGRIVMDE